MMGRGRSFNILGTDNSGDCQMYVGPQTPAWVLDEQFGYYLRSAAMADDPDVWSRVEFCREVRKRRVMIVRADNGRNGFCFGLARRIEGGDLRVYEIVYFHALRDRARLSMRDWPTVVLLFASIDYADTMGAAPADEPIKAVLRIAGARVDLWCALLHKLGCQHTHCHDRVTGREYLEIAQDAPLIKEMRGLLKTRQVGPGKMATGFAGAFH